MARRDQLVNLVRLFSLIAVVAISIPFILSLLPSRNAGSDLPHIYIGDMPAGSYRIEASGVKGWVGKKWLVIRDYDEKIYLYTLPADEGRILLPDTTWYRYAGSCEKFHPEMENKRIKPGGVVKCHDEPLRDQTEWRWTYQGKSLGNSTPDLPRQRYSLEGYHLVVGKK